MTVPEPVAPAAPPPSRGLARDYWKMWTSRQQWVDYAGQSCLYNPYIACLDMFVNHMRGFDGLKSRGVGSLWGLFGICRLYSNGRDAIHKMLGLMTPDSMGTRAATYLADTAYMFLFNIPIFGVNYAAQATDLKQFACQVIKTSAATCWMGPLAGVVYETFNALDKDDPRVKARVLKPIRWALIDRFELPTRKKLIWAALAATTAATAAVYSFAPGGMINH